MIGLRPEVEGYVLSCGGLFSCAACGGSTRFHGVKVPRDSSDSESLYECLECGAVELWAARVGVLS